MKTTMFKRRAEGACAAPGSNLFNGRAIAGMLMLPLLLAAISARALPGVSTISGGPGCGYLDGDTFQDALFCNPIGLALGTDPSGLSVLYVADRDNDAVRKLELSLGFTVTFASTSAGISKPVGVVVDGNANLYVLNQGNGTNGTIIKLDRFGDVLGTNATGLVNANAMAIDGGANLYVTVSNNTIIQVAPSGAKTTLLTLNNAGTLLQGIAVLDDGSLAVVDSGRNGILVVNTATHATTNWTGFNGAGDHFGAQAFSQFNQPMGIANAGQGFAVVTDYGNHRVKTVDPFGNVCSLYGVCPANWVTPNYPGWWDGSGCPCDTTCETCNNYAESRLPAGVTVAPGGSVYTTEDYYQLIRLTTGAGFTGPGVGSVGTNGAVTLVSPVISPNSGYYPMGELITVSSPNPGVYYTTDGTEPTTNSFPVVMTGNQGTIHWFNSLADLTSLRVKAFSGTNASATVSGQPSTANVVGVPLAPTPSGAIYGGIGSTIVVPVVADLQSGVTVKSYQFRVEVAPNGAAPMIPAGYDVQDIQTNDFVQLITAAQGAGATGHVAVASYTIGTTVGLQISAIGSGNGIQFQKFAVVALLKVPIPSTANSGDSYSISVSYPSATSDGGSANVPITTMSPTTILVTNVNYTVGDSASSYGGWYNAGLFGDGDLLNSDVNSAFFAATGLRVPYAYSDVFNAMDAFPPDADGFVGGDGQIRFLDWQLILQRSLRLDTNNWSRSWSAGGNLVNSGTNLYLRPFSRQSPDTSGPWYRQVLIGADSVGNATAGATVSMPVYVKLGDGSTLSGLQFRSIVTPQGGAPAPVQAPVFTPASGFSNPSFQQSFLANSRGFGWTLGAFSFQSRSSNFIGWVSITIPSSATVGQTYAVSFGNPDGSPDIHTQYQFESRSAYATVSAAAPPASICSDEWKIYFFGSLTDPRASDYADPDGDGFPNWMEYLAGTDPTDPTSRLQFTTAQKKLVGGQPQMSLQWLTAAGKAYQVLVTTNLFSPSSWSVLGTVSGNGAITNYPDSNVSSKARYYRLQILQ